MISNLNPRDSEPVLFSHRYLVIFFFLIHSKRYFAGVVNITNQLTLRQGGDQGRSSKIVGALLKQRVFFG